MVRNLQGPVGAALIVAAVVLLASWEWALVAAGVFLLVAAASDR